MNKQELIKETDVTMKRLIYEKGYVAYVDLFMIMGILSKKDYEDWRMGKVKHLESVVKGSLGKINTVIKEVKRLSVEMNLRPSKTVYKQWGKGKGNDLQFSKSGARYMEEIYATHYVSIQSKTVQ